MSTIIKTIHDEISEGTVRMRALLDAAETRTLSADEAREFDALDASLRRLSATAAARTRGGDLLDLVSVASGRAPIAGASWAHGLRRPTLGAALAESDAYQAMRAEGRTSLPRRATLEMKALTISELCGPVIAPAQPAAPGDVPPPILSTRTRVAQLPAPGRVESGSGITFMQETGLTGTAAPVASAALKPTVVLNAISKHAELTTLAGLITIPDTLFEDAPSFTSWVNARLVTEVLNVLDAQILVGTGVAPQMAGIIPQVGAPPVAVTAPQSFYDALIAQALAIESLSGLVVDSVVMSASTYALVTGQKSTTAGNYLVGVPSVASLQTIGPWRLALNSNVAAGTALLGAFSTGSILLTRGGVRVDMSNAADDNFSHDLITVRAEVRAALALVSPRGFGLVTGITAV